MAPAAPRALGNPVSAVAPASGAQKEAGGDRGQHVGGTRRSRRPAEETRVWTRAGAWSLAVLSQSLLAPPFPPGVQCSTAWTHRGARPRRPAARRGASRRTRVWAAPLLAEGARALNLLDLEPSRGFNA